jgi:hypothetical protein
MREEFMQDNPLVMPTNQALGLPKYLVRPFRTVGGDEVDHGVMELEEGQVHLRDDEVLVVSWIPHQRGHLTVPGQITGKTLIDEEFRAPASSVVEMGVSLRPCAIDTIEL